MAINRYDKAAISAYTPRTFEETLIVPMMKRKQHDLALNSYQDQLSQLTKVDPLKEHTPEAMEIQAAVRARIEKQVDDLNSRGFNTNINSDVYKTNRDLQELMAPTGRLGKINASKIVYNKNYAAFEKNALDNHIPADRIPDLWKQRIDERGGYNGYDDQNDIKDVSSYGVANYQDYQKEKALAHSIMGHAKTASAQKGWTIKQMNDGSYANVNSYGKVMDSTNLAQLNESKIAQKLFWTNPEGEGYKYNQDAGVDNNVFANRLEHDWNSMLETGHEYETGSDASMWSSAPTGPEGGYDSTVGEDYNTQEIGGENSGVDAVLQVGLAKPFSSTDFNNNTLESNTIDDVKDIRIKERYNNIWNKMSGKGLMIDGKYHKLTPEMIKKGKNSHQVAEVINKYMKKTPITLTSKLITTDQQLSGKGFSAAQGTTIDDIDKNIRRQLQGNLRKLIDENGNEFTWNDLVEEYDVKPEDVLYQGQLSPHNWENNSFEGSNSKYSPHIFSIKDKEGKSHSFQASRTNSDNYGVNTERLKDLQINYRNATMNYGDFNDFKSNSKGLSGLKIKFDPSSDHYDKETGEKLDWVIRAPGKEDLYLTEGDYMNTIHSTK